MLLTAELVFSIYMLANEKHKATFLAPIGIGLVLFVAEMVGVYYTGGSLNPARSFGPCVVSGVWDDEHWIYCSSFTTHPFSLSQSLPPFSPFLAYTAQKSLTLIFFTTYRGRSRSWRNSRLGFLSIYQNVGIRNG